MDNRRVTTLVLQSFNTWINISQSKFALFSSWSLSQTNLSSTWKTRRHLYSLLYAANKTEKAYHTTVCIRVSLFTFFNADTGVEIVGHVCTSVPEPWHLMWIRIRIRGSMPLTNVSESCYFSNRLSRRQRKSNLKKSFSAYYFLKVHFHNF